MSYEISWTVNGGATTRTTHDTLQEASDELDTKAAALTVDDTVVFVVTYTSDGRKAGGNFTAT